MFVRSQFCNNSFIIINKYWIKLFKLSSIAMDIFALLIKPFTPKFFNFFVRNSSHAYTDKPSDVQTKLLYNYSIRYYTIDCYHIHPHSHSL